MPEMRHSAARGTRRLLRDRRFAVALGQLGILLLIALLWEGSVAIGWLNANRAGEPSAIWNLFVAALKNGTLWGNLKVTLYEELTGFAIGVGGGTLIGLGLWWSRTLSQVLEPFAVAFNGIPKIALAPPMIVWFGIFETSKIVLAASICFIIAWIAAYEGTRFADRDQVDMLRAMGGSRWDAFIRVVVPSAMPWVVSAMKINIGLALAGAIVGEFVASNHGLGFLAVQATIMFQMSELWMLVFVITLVAAIQYLVLLWVERRTIAWAETGWR